MSATNITLTIKHIESRNTNSALKAQFNTQWAKKHFLVMTYVTIYINQ